MTNLKNLETETLGFMLRTATQRLNRAISEGKFASTIAKLRDEREAIAIEIACRKF